MFSFSYAGRIKCECHFHKQEMSGYTDGNRFDVCGGLGVLLVVEAVSEKCAKLTQGTLERVGDSFLGRLSN